MEFTFNSKPESKYPDIDRIRQELEKIEYGKFVSASHISDNVGVVQSTLRTWLRDGSLNDNAIRRGKFYWLGSKKTVEAYRKAKK